MALFGCWSTRSSVASGAGERPGLPHAKAQIVSPWGADHFTCAIFAASRETWGSKENRQCQCQDQNHS